MRSPEESLMIGMELEFPLWSLTPDPPAVTLDELLERDEPRRSLLAGLLVLAAYKQRSPSPIRLQHQCRQYSHNHPLHRAGRGGRHSD